MSETARKRHRRHANPFTVRGPIALPDWQAVFGRPAPFALDIGCGPGLFTTALAQQHPEWNVLGLEIRPHLVDDVLQAARLHGLTNLHAVLANANFHLDSLLPNHSVAFVAVNFPDPWYKKRHHKRRVINTQWLDTLATKLRPEAALHVMSDYPPIAHAMRDLLDQTAYLENLDGVGQFAAASTTGIASEREIKHLSRGETIFRLRYRYRLAKGVQIL